MLRYLLIFLLTFSFPASGYCGEWTTLIAHELAVSTMRPLDLSPKVPRSQCQVCKGTGRIKAGDTVTVVERECDNCEPDSKPAEELAEEPAELSEDPVEEETEPEAPPPERYLLIFTAEWCGPCKQLKSRSIPGLVSKGLTVAPDGDIRYVDFDRNPELVSQFQVTLLPTIILMIDGQEQGRLVGSHPTETLYNFFQSSPKLPPTAKRPWLKYGTLTKVNPQIQKLRETLDLIGPSGDLEIRPHQPGDPVVFEVSETTSLTLKMPLRVSYQIEGEVIRLSFREPIPLRYRFLSGSISGVEISTSHINVRVLGLPDGFFKIQS